MNELTQDGQAIDESGLTKKKRPFTQSVLFQLLVVTLVLLVGAAIYIPKFIRARS